MTIEQKLITVDEFEEFLAEHPSGLYELLHGEIVEKVPTQEHGVIATKISARLLVFMEDNNIQGHVAVEARFSPTDDELNDRLPDVSVHLTDKPPVAEGAVEGMPNLAVEIKSPKDSNKLMRDKAEFYLENGCQLVWLVYPDKKSVEVFQPDKNFVHLVMGDMLDGGDVLPGFTLPVATLFP
jgi:Uma2 family endonuclease